VLVSDLGITAQQIAGIIKLREDGAIGSNAADELFGMLCSPFTPRDVDPELLIPFAAAPHAAPGADPAQVAASRGMIIVRDEGAVAKWCERAIADNAQSADDVRAGKLQALGRLVGAAMKNSAGQGDAQAIRKTLLEMLGAKE
jgi:aspartyl-tRNA(Asn)/glutamyl-tRNA(Gln) amidotransferase subunit B